MLLAGSPLVAGMTGKYFEDCHEAARYAPGMSRGFADHAVDPRNAARLWSLSHDLLASAGCTLA